MTSTIRKQTVEEHGALLGLISEFDRALSRLPEDIDWGEVMWAQDQELLDLVRVQTTSLRCATDIATRGYYRESYNTIRMVFEGYLVLRLISTCDKYPTWYRIPRNGESLNDAKLRAKRKLTEQGIPDLVKIEDEGTGQPYLVLIRRGMRIVDQQGNDTGAVIPYYYGAWSQYLPKAHHLQRPIIKRQLLQDWALSSRAGTHHDQTRHRDLYRRLFTFDSMIKNLRWNGVLSYKTGARARVHYNYLSGYTHSTKDALTCSQPWHSFRTTDADIAYNHYKSELALLYVCHFLGMHLRLLLHYFRRWRASHVRNANKLYYPLCRRLDEDFGYFWFIFNHPHEFDRFQHANRRCDPTRHVLFRPSEIRLGDVRYYDDPLERLRDMHESQLELATGNVYNSPFPRDDAALPIF